MYVPFNLLLSMPQSSCTAVLHENGVAIQLLWTPAFSPLDHASSSGWCFRSTSLCPFACSATESTWTCLPPCKVAQCHEHPDQQIHHTKDETRHILNVIMVSVFMCYRNLRIHIIWQLTHRSMHHIHCHTLSFRHVEQSVRRVIPWKWFLPHSTESYCIHNHNFGVLQRTWSQHILHAIACPAFHPIVHNLKCCRRSKIDCFRFRKKYTGCHCLELFLDV